jgi:hypothetical protein
MGITSGKIVIRRSRFDWNIKIIFDRIGCLKMSFYFCRGEVTSPLHEIELFNIWFFNLERAHTGAPLPEIRRLK